MNLAYPYQLSPLGRTAETSDARHIRDLIEQVLFTIPGERVMRPDFGSGVAQLVFAPNSVELASATQMLIQGSLQQWLGELIVVQAVRVEAEDAVMSITVQYSIRSNDQVQVQTFTQPAGGGP
ncbi:GPW/gp25 family protein [Bradyrhizobium liaoningense]|uniref:GPW/gp25 family protein n=1 Tax=Bradyrhizobium liaoningense TaxID=43992 RepID=UPI001BA4A4DC|nr:GPW/gp25 family protein [Bradyrhizobium liaoningense]MBR0713541.1 GPW/gp25 family protein [Bradyrhizobium liaoningense]